MIFCSNCGAQITDNSVFCPYCGAQVNNQPTEQPQPAQTYNPQPTQQNNVAYDDYTANYGLGKAITGTAFSVFAWFLIYLGFNMGVVPLIIFSIISTPFYILAICFGASSIGNYKHAKNHFQRNPIETLILGICSLTFGALCALMFLYYVIVLLSFI